jgi:outer membrane receptor protein involved in Fe transport
MPVSHPKHPSPRFLVRTPVAAAVLLALGSPAALAQVDTTLGEVIVTAQKREQSLQDVPISIDALGEQKLDELNVQNFKDYVQFLPSVTMAPSDGAGSGFSAVYMRGIATGGDGQATTSQPSVGMYLDEQPITTVQGNLDVHLYDIARVEALAGPQGTLYGASSQAGTIRIITNKPDPSGFAGGYSFEGNYVDLEDFGYVAEGFVNLPISETAAIRLVGWAVHDAGWIDNVAATRLYEGDPLDDADDFLADNAAFAEDNYNTIDTIGARAALRINLGENWTVTPQLSYQKMEQEGSWADDVNDVMASGSQAVAHFRDEFTNDEWYQAGLTVEGSIGNFEVVYAGNYLDRDVDGAFDYSEYSYWYNDYLTYFNSLFVDNAGNQLDPSAGFTNNDRYTKTSHELRISTPQDKRVRGLLGFFYQKQEHDFYQEFGLIDGLADSRTPNGQDPNGQNQFPGVVYLNSMDRVDTDEAVFGTVAFDITDTLELSLGARYFKPEVTVKGFFGFGIGYNRPFTPGYGEDNIPGTADDTVGEPGDPRTGGDGAYDINSPWWGTQGEWRCRSQEDDGNDTPCQNVDKGISESDSVFRVNLSWKASETAMLYATWSEGYRPGGVQRDPFAGEFVSDFLTNYELGWKARFAGDRLQINGAVFLDTWDDIQIAFQGDNGITQVDNGPSAEVQGVEVQFEWLATDSFRLGAALSYYDSKLKDDYCDFDPPGVCANVNAPAGTPLPLTPDFKGNLIARYSFPLASFESYVQGALAYQTSRASTLAIAENDVLGDIPSSTYLDLAFGLDNDKYAIELFLSNATDEDAALSISVDCTVGVCGPQPWAVQNRPRTFGIRFKQEF